MAKQTLNKKTKTDTIEDLKKQAVKKNPVQKGYNEKNIQQEQGAFVPDNAKK
jgi:hypothetical protein